MSEEGSKSVRTQARRSAEANKRQGNQTSLVEKHLPLVVKIARSFGGNLPLADKVQEGAIGLMRAAQLFDPKRGVAFGHYASYWIRQAIMHALARDFRSFRIPERMGKRIRRMETLSARLTRDLGRSPSLSELSREVGVPTKRLRQLKRLRRSAAPLGEDAIDKASRGGDASIDADRWTRPDRVIQQRAKRSHVARLLGRLRPRERYVLCQRFGLISDRPVPVRELARELSLSPQRVRMIVNESLDRIRSDGSVASLQCFI